MASKNLPKPVTLPSEGYHWLGVLAAELALRLTEARDSVPTVWPKSIVLHARQGWEPSRSKQAPFPFARNLNADVVRAAGEKLWKELIGPDSSASKPLKVTYIGLGFSGIEAQGSGQPGIEGFFTKSSDADKSPSLKRKREEDLPGATVSDDDDRCQRCGKHLRLSPSLDVLDEEARRAAVETVRSEHQDWHFAKDLAKLPQSPMATVSGAKKVNKEVRGKGEKPKGIAKYFSKK